jgi:ethanolamine utilization protein EutQ (cupin superfamily)
LDSRTAELLRQIMESIAGQSQREQKVKNRNRKYQSKERKAGIKITEINKWYLSK